MRMAALVLLKPVFHDIFNLSQLYRVGVLVGLAFIVLVSSFLCQKFSMKLKNRKKSAENASES